MIWIPASRMSSSSISSRVAVAAAEQLLKYPVKLRTDLGKLFCELAPHASVQLLDDLVQGPPGP